MSIKDPVSDILVFGTQNLVFLQIILSQKHSYESSNFRLCLRLLISVSTGWDDLKLKLKKLTEF